MAVLTDFTKRELSIMTNAVTLALGGAVEIQEAAYGAVTGWAVGFFVTINKIHPSYPTNKFTVMIADTRDEVFVYQGHVERSEIWSSEIEKNFSTPFAILQISEWGQNHVKLAK